MIEIAEELELQAAWYASLATDGYPETIFPPPRSGEMSTPDAYTAAGYRNAYLSVARDLRARAAELRAEAAMGGGPR
jgi:hypothetical protein